MNMIVQATDRACGWIVANTQARHYHLFGGLESEKRPAALLLPGGKGKKVTAGATIPADLLKAYLHVSPTQLTELWHHGVLGNIQAGSIGHGGQLANGVTAIFIACGQDVANVANSAIGITDFEITDQGSLHVSITMASLTVATVGGGTALGTGRECLGLLGCEGAGKARKFAEIIAATLLAGEISFAAAVATGEFVAAHERYGRNRPDQSP
jgi:hydroxymethylglutaryl-CoA reductase (NADPH)